jgi:hypothetical protein
MLRCARTDNTKRRDILESHHHRKGVISISQAPQNRTIISSALFCIILYIVHVRVSSPGLTPRLESNQFEINVYQQSFA